MIECPSCDFYGPNCPGPDSDECPNAEYINEDCVKEEYTEDHVEHGEQKYVQFNEENCYDTDFFSHCQPPNRKKTVLELYFFQHKRQCQIVEITGYSKSSVSRYVRSGIIEVEKVIKKMAN